MSDLSEDVRKRWEKALAELFCSNLYPCKEHEDQATDAILVLAPLIVEWAAPNPRPAPPSHPDQQDHLTAEDFVALRAQARAEFLAERGDN